MEFFEAMREEDKKVMDMKVKYLLNKALLSYECDMNLSYEEVEAVRDFVRYANEIVKESTEEFIYE